MSCKVPRPHLDLHHGLWRCRVRSWYGWVGRPRRTGYFGNCPFYPTTHGATREAAYNQWVDAVQAERLAAGRYPAPLNYAMEAARCHS